MNWRLALSLSALSLAVTGCSLIPTYHRPDMPVAAAWPQGAAYPHAAAAQEKTAPDVGWQDFFKDPGLRQVIALSLENNRDLRAAVLKVQAFQALHRISQAKLLPHFGAGASADDERLPHDVSISGLPGRQDVYSVNLGMASYEVDFFGKIRSMSQATLEQYLATEDAQRAEQIALVGSVASAYLTWRTDQNEARVTDDTLAVNERGLELVTRNAKAGIVSDLAVRQAAVAVNTARTVHAADTRQVAQDLNALQYLLGAPLPQDLAASENLDDTLIYDLPVGLSSDVLLRRPDIHAAEHQLLAENANIGAARAAFFPSITLTASAGTTSGKLQDLFTAGEGFWAFAPQINVPIFNAGELKASLDYAKIQQQIGVVNYEKAIQNGFREVADGLAARQTYVEQYQAQKDAVSNDEAYLSLAQDRFSKGVTSRLTVLDAQRELLSARRQLLRDRMAQLTAEVSLYTALGGGFDREQVRRNQTGQVTLNHVAE